MRVFWNLGYSLDLILHTQMASSWLRGLPFLYENHTMGSHFGTHSYFLLIPLGLIAAPFGAPGLLLVLAASYGLAFYFAARILERLGAPALLAMPLILSPLSIHVFHNREYGFHVEQLQPALGIFLLHEILFGTRTRALFAALLLLAIKEDAPLLVGAIALAVWNRNAKSVFFAAAAALPILFAIIALAGGQGQAARMGTIRGGPIDWLISHQNITNLLAVIAAGLCVRPRFLLLALPFSVIAWLQNDDPLWSPRFAPALALAWTLGILGIANAWKIHRKIASAIVAASIVLGALLAADDVDLFANRPWTLYTAEEVADADELFLPYRAISRKDESVIAHVYLWRYAHDRNLYWFYHRNMISNPEWILWDHGFLHFEKWVDPAPYERIAEKGRFALYRRK